MDERKLKGIPLFADLDRSDLRRLGSATDEIDVPAGKELLHQGAYAYEFMVIEDGTAEVVRDGDHVADLGPGDFLGEIAALERGKRTATVTATSPMCLAVMTAHDLRAIAATIPRLEQRLKETAAERHPLAQPA